MKETLRRTLQKKRKTITKSELLEKSISIQKRLFSLPEFNQAKTILFYVSYDNEVFTHEMIKESLSKGKTIVIPKTNTKKNTLTLLEVTCWDDLEKGAYTILEPKKHCIKEIPLPQIDLLIIPGVGFDPYGNRIGHGMGYYDRLLKQTPHNVCIALAFEFQIVEHIPAEEHDIRVHKIITEERVITCSSS